MLTIILTYFIIILAILGLTISIENLWLYIIRPKNAPNKVLIVFLEKDIAEMQIREINEERLWSGNYRNDNIFFINNGLDYNDFIKLKDIYETNNMRFIENTEINNWITLKE